MMMKTVLIILAVLLSIVPISALVFIIGYFWEKGKLTGLDSHCRKDETQNKKTYETK